MTKTLRQHSNPLYRSVEVTTKHSYVVNHKYLWICAGSVPSAARAYLALDDDPGCGAEYGRHSKSIHPDKHRCGKCKGLLVQVKPKPRRVEANRKSPRKGVNPFKKSDEKILEDAENGKGSDNMQKLRQALEIVELSD